MDESLEAEEHEGHEHEAATAEEGHDHEAEENHEEHADEAGHENEEAGRVIAFRMVEVIAGMQESGYTEIKLVSPLPFSTQIVMNAACYMLADMKK